MQGVPPLCGRMPIRGWRDGMSTLGSVPAWLGGWWWVCTARRSSTHGSPLRFRRLFLPGRNARRVQVMGLIRLREPGSYPYRRRGRWATGSCARTLCSCSAQHYEGRARRGPDSQAAVGFDSPPTWSPSSKCMHAYPSTYRETEARKCAPAPPGISAEVDRPGEERRSRGRWFH